MSTTLPSQADLYERDFVRWTDAQAKELRRAAAAGSNLPLDWAHLAEEVEGLGSRDRREIASRIEQIVLHLLRLQFSPAENPRIGWQETIDRERGDIEELLTQSPSLRREVALALDRRWPSARRRAQRALADELQGPVLPNDCPYAADEVLGPEWWPTREVA